MNSIQGNEIKAWKEQAVSDFKASKILDQNGLFSQALFLLQQSVEKIIKVTALENGITTVQALKNDSHMAIKYTHKAYYFLLKRPDILELINRSKSRDELFNEFELELKSIKSALEKNLKEDGLAGLESIKCNYDTLWEWSTNEPWDCLSFCVYRGNPLVICRRNLRNEKFLTNERQERRIAQRTCGQYQDKRRI